MSAGALAGANGKRRSEATLWGWCLAGLVLAGAVFVAFPEIDLWVSRAAYSSSGGFIGQRNAWIEWLRKGFMVFYWICIAVSVLGWALALRTRQAWLGADARKWLFMVLCLSVGPGLLANVAFKQHWGRARPKQVVEFAGTKLFSPAPMPSHQCRRNCSFVSGEAASTFVPFYAAAAIVPQWGATLVIAGTISGLAAGSVRIAQGAHFLSDVVFAGFLMALTVLALRRLMRASAQAQGPPARMVAGRAAPPAS
jgi:lipid A 4'-phosphatase